MTRKKTTILILLCGVLLIAMLSGCGKDDSETDTPTPTPEPTATLASESAATPTPKPIRETHTSGAFTYVLLGNQTAEITRYSGSDADLIIPSSLDGFSVTSIGDFAFYFFNNLSSVTIPDSVTSVGAYAFGGCDSLTSVIIPDSVISIGDDAFSGCNILTSVTIPNSVTSIGTNPFRACFKMSNIVVSSDHPLLECIDGVLFDKVNKILICYPRAFTETEYSIPQGVKTIGASAFYYCDDLLNVTIPDSVCIIGDRAFSGCSLTDVAIPDSVTSIGDCAFQFCHNLENVTIPDSVTNIGANPFELCRALSKIVVSPDHPTLASIDGVLFSKADKCLVCYPCASTKVNYSIPSGVLIIGDYAFEYCRSLNSVTIPDSVTSIGAYAFGGCDGLSSLTIPNSITYIGDYAFNDCDNLTSVTIPNSVTNIGVNPFEMCRTLNSINVSKDNPALVSIDGVLFSNADNRLICYPCASTRGEYSIPQGVQIIGDSAFDYCRNLSNVTIPDGVISIGDRAFFDCENLSGVTIPDGATSIGESAFYWCYGLSYVTIPDSMVSIGDYAFSFCKLSAVTIPDSVAFIGRGAFDPHLDDLTITVSRDSYAKQYCIYYGLNYIYPDQNDWLNK